MEPEGSLPHSQQPTVCPHFEPDESFPYPQSYFFKIDFIIILLSTPGFSKWSLYLRFFHQNPVCTHHIKTHHIITRSIFGEEYRS